MRETIDKAVRAVTNNQARVSSVAQADDEMLRFTVTNGNAMVGISMETAVLDDQIAFAFAMLPVGKAGLCKVTASTAKKNIRQKRAALKPKIESPSEGGSIKQLDEAFVKGTQDEEID